MTTIKQRVSRGIELLDQEVPDWFDKIDLDDLDLSSARSCVLGQVFYKRGGEAGFYIGAPELFKKVKREFFPNDDSHDICHKYLIFGLRHLSKELPKHDV